MKQVSVLIAGGGPVGLTLAHDLARRDVDCMLVERNSTTTRHPKMDHTNPRSMELFSLAGLEPALRAAAVPEDHSFDISWISTMTGYEIKRYPYPSPAESRKLYRAKNDGTQPFTPSMRVSQTEIEPVLRAAAEQESLTSIRFSTELIDVEQYADYVIASVRSAETGNVEQIQCKYLAGCDGGNSTAREAIGIAQSGKRRIMPRFMTLFRAQDSEACALLQRWGENWHYQSNHGTLVSLNDRDTWTLHTRYPANEVDGESPEKLVARFVGKEIPIEVLVANPWSPHLLVSDMAGSNRVWLAGDAGHQYIPTGGYGMNTGIGDAYGLSWALAAVLKGFGGPGLLPAYDAERRSVWHRNRTASERYNQVRVDIAALYGSDLDIDSEEGAAARVALSKGIERLGNDECESLGIELGYHYAGSPIIAAEAGAIPPQDYLRYEPSSLPGVRLPSLFLETGQPLYGLLGRWFTLLAFEGADSSDFAAAALERDVPLEVVRIHDQNARRLLAADLILVRPDQHVAWRGNSSTRSAAAAILDRVTGWATA